MKEVTILLLAISLVSCSRDSDIGGVVYSGKANLNTQIHEFTATNSDTQKEIVLTMTGPRELTFSLNDRLSHIDYEKDVIIIKSETDNSEWTAKSVRGGFELEDGTRLEYNNCRDWAICLHDGATDEPILKGKYSLAGNNAEITLWISDSEVHVELLALMANALFNKSRNNKETTESALQNLSNQVWTF